MFARKRVCFAGDVEHAHQTVAEEQGLGQHGRVRAAFREAGDRVRRGPEVVDDHRLATLGHRPCHPLAETEAPVAPVCVASRIGPGDEPLAVLIPEPDHALAATGQLHHPLCDEVKKDAEIQLARDLHADGTERLELPSVPPGRLFAPLLLLVHSRVLDGDGGVVGEEAEELLVLLRETASGIDSVDGDHPEESLPVGQWLGNHADMASPLEEQRCDVRGGTEVVEDHAFSALRDHPCGPLAELQAQLSRPVLQAMPHLWDEDLACLIPEE